MVGEFKSPFQGGGGHEDQVPLSGGRGSEKPWSVSSSPPSRGQGVMKIKSPFQGVGGQKNQYNIPPQFPLIIWRSQNNHFTSLFGSKFDIK